MAAQNRDARAAIAYHDATKHSQQSLPEHSHFLDWNNEPLRFKIYRELEPVPLVHNAPELEQPALEAIAALPRPRGKLPRRVRAARPDAGDLR